MFECACRTLARRPKREDERRHEHDTIINQGLISADVQGLEVLVRSDEFHNEGVLEAINGGIIAGLMLASLPPTGAAASPCCVRAGLL